MADDESTETETNETTDQAEDDQSDAKTGEDTSGTSEEKADADDPSFGKKEDEPANEVQMKYMRPLAEDMGEEIPDGMSEADAAAKINEMQENAAS